jgi:hypothetical protein
LKGDNGLFLYHAGQTLSSAGLYGDSTTKVRHRQSTGAQMAMLLLPTFSKPLFMATFHVSTPQSHYHFPNHSQKITWSVKDGQIMTSITFRCRCISIDLVNRRCVLLKRHILPLDVTSLVFSGIMFYYLFTFCSVSPTLPFSRLLSVNIERRSSLFYL